MVLIGFAMVLILVVAAAVVAYVAFPHRGQQMPVMPWLGDAMHKTVESMPTGATPEDFYEHAESSSR